MPRNWLVLIVPVRFRDQTDEPEVLLVEDHRATNADGPALRVIVGLSATEGASAAAKRVLATEAGMDAHRWDLVLGALTPMGSATIHLFMARGLRPIGDRAGAGRWVRLDDALELAGDGAIRDLATLAALPMIAAACKATTQ